GPGTIAHPAPGTPAVAPRVPRTRLAMVATVLIAAAGVLAAVLVVVARGHGHGGPGTAAAASVAPAPTFGASLPISTPAAAASGGSSASVTAGDAQLRDPATVTAVLTAAKAAIETVDSYDYRRLAGDRAAGDAASTGSFRTRYDAALSGIAATAKRTRTVQVATVQKIAISALSDDGTQASVLAFGRVLTTDTAHPGSSTSALASAVTLHRVGSAWRIGDMTDLGDRGTFAATPPGNPALVAAVTAGAAEVVNLLSYSRADFDADFNRAMDGLTAPLRAQRLAQRDPLHATMDRSQSDFAGTVRSVGIESADGSSVLLLVCATGYRTTAGGTPVSGTQRVEVGVSFVHGRWLVSEYVVLPTGG
ncbi:MAG: hypothetical protein ACRDVG_07940, partial [Jatrophihabitantaceae bacterium]